MSVIRQDPITDRWVVIATERAARPKDFEVGEDELAGGYCPFCPGHEQATPNAIFEYRDDDSDRREADTDRAGEDAGENWQVRVVPNKYPAVSADEQLEERGDDLFREISGVGAHEVIIESPDHVTDPADLSADQLGRIVETWRHRISDLEGDQRLEYALLFKNHGAQAGATIEHVHSQLLAMPLVPRQIRDELDGSREYHEANDQCIYCDLVAHNLDDGRRLVYANDDVVVFTPYASRFPFELCLAPRRHHSHFEDHPSAIDTSIAEALDVVVGSLNQALDEPPYNLVVHTAPLHADSLDHFHWHIELIPALSHIAGFEWGTGCHINPTAPESAAEHLRDIDADR